MLDKNLPQSTQEQNVSKALLDLTLTYIKDWQQAYQSLPTVTELADEPSPCLEKALELSTTHKDLVPNGAWYVLPRQQTILLDAVEKGIEIDIHSDIHAFYGSQYSADLTLTWQDKPFTLLQVWNDDDFMRLQENILGHLVTQKRLKLKPTVFIGALDSEKDIISICNITGEVLHERLGTNQRDILAPDIAYFLAQCEVQI